ncbi:MAG: ComF family protein [Azospirillum sp.]|nr:ComF family protein [Azospirillum sp.]
MSGSVAALAAQIIGRIAQIALDLVLPPRCLWCGQAVGRQGGICPLCWSRLSFIGSPCCDCCGLPFPHDLADDADGTVFDGLLCGACTKQRPPYHRARAVLVYDDASRPLVLGLKHGDRTYSAGTFGAWLARAGAELLVGADFLVPVPLHRWRLFRRRYNQSALLAIAAGEKAGVTVEADLLVRSRATRSQGGLDRSGRHRNVRGAFRLRRGAAPLIKGAHLVVIDDVLTTGATVEECARLLLAAGAGRVDVLTLARVVRGL